jgi:hypothetical protein
MSGIVPYGIQGLTIPDIQIQISKSTYQRLQSGLLPESHALFIVGQTSVCALKQRLSAHTNFRLLRTSTHRIAAKVVITDGSLLNQPVDKNKHTDERDE